MIIHHVHSGAVAEVDDELGQRLISDGSNSWSAAVAPKRTRRTKAQIAADEAAKTEE